MQKRILGKTGFSVTDIGCGLWGMSGWSGSDDAASLTALQLAVDLGCNFFDTAWAYGEGKSDGFLGKILVANPDKRLYSASKIPPKNRKWPARPQYDYNDVFPADHVLAHADLIRHALGVDTIDVYYLHNPETQLGEFPPEEFEKRMHAAFEFLETAVAEGKIRYYGLATWNGFRQPENARDALSLAKIDILARALAGEGHHCRFVQLPYNLGMTEALTLPNQAIDSRTLPMIEAAHALGITLVASASLLQGQVARNLPPFIAEALGLENDAERALQFVLSTPGISTALVGMSHVEHVRENLRLVGIAPAPQDVFTKLFERRAPAP